jgi:WD40 repeat protein
MINTSHQNPYIGPRTFRKEEGHLFFGRDREARDLAALVASEKLVLFYAQSGAGKSSLINTRLIPELEQKNFEVLPVGRVSGNAAQAVNIDNIYLYNLYRSLLRHEANDTLLSNLTLPQFLDKLNEDENGYFYDESLTVPIRTNPEIVPWPRALIIDQFEEIFSTNVEAWHKREDSFCQLANAMNADPYLWVILVMREDQIASLDPYAHLMPGGLRVRYYMQRLSHDAAIEAVKNPVENLRPYAPGVAEKLVKDLSSINVQDPDGSTMVQVGQYIEPVQLQVVCYSLWEGLSAGNEITERDLKEVGDVNESLGKYYDQRVHDVAATKNVKERMIREWFEKKLITPGRIRNMVLQERESKPGELDDDVIQALQSDLVRSEKRGGATWYELTHDRLVEPIITSNNKWFSENLSPLQRQAALWKDQEKNESWLLRGKALAEVKHWEKVRQEELTDTEKEFLESSRSLVARERRVRWLNRSIAILGLLAIILALYAYRVKLQAQYQASVSLARQLAAQSDTALEEYPVQGILLASEANLGRESGEQYVAAAEEALRAALKDTHGIPLPGHEGSVHSLAFSPDGRWLATGSADKVIYLWKMNEDGRIGMQYELTGHTDSINILSFSPDNHWLASGSDDHTARLWDLTAVNPGDSPKILPDHEREITALAFSPDGHWLATGSMDETARLWNLTAPDPTKEPLILETPYGWIRTLAFSPDGNWLATGGGGGVVGLWDLRMANQNMEAIELEGHSDSILALAFSPDGNWLASGSADKTSQLWHIDHLNSTRSLEKPYVLLHSDKVNTLAFRPARDHTNFLATGSEDGAIRLWDLNAPDPPAHPVLLPGHTGSVKTLSFSPDGRWLASGSGDHQVRVWDINSPVPAVNPAILRGHDDDINTLAFSPDGRWLASGSQDGSIRLWDQLYGDPEVSPILLQGHEDDINSLAFSPDGHWLATGSADNTARLWDLNVPDPAHNFKALSGHTAWIEILAISPDGHWLATGSGDATTRIWDLTAPDPEAKPYILSGHSEWIRTLAFSPDGHWLATGSADDTIQLWDFSSGRPTSNSIVLGGHNGDIYTLAFSPDNHWLATGSGDNIVRLWDISSPGKLKEPFELVGHRDNILTLAFSRSGRWLATGGGDGDPRVLLWDLNASDPASNPKVLAGHSGRINTVAFSPDNHWLASGSGDQTVRLWNVESSNPGADFEVLRGHANTVNTLAFSEDKQWLATGSDDGTALLWDLTAPHPEEEPIRLSDHQGPVKTLAFSLDSHWLATGSEDNTVRLWLVRFEDLETMACQIAGRNLTQDEWNKFLPQLAYRKTCKQWPEGH